MACLTLALNNSRNNECKIKRLLIAILKHEYENSNEGSYESIMTVVIPMFISWKRFYYSLFENLIFHEHYFQSKDISEGEIA